MNAVTIQSNETGHALRECAEADGEHDCVIGDWRRGFCRRHTRHRHDGDNAAAAMAR
jgi:hypothetical protein